MTQDMYSGDQPPPPDPSGRPLADRVPGAVEHGIYDAHYAARTAGAPQPPPPRGFEDRPVRRASGWNGPGLGLLALFLLVLAAVLWPQVKARQTEAKIRPLASAIAGRDAGARCPRYITQIFTNAGSVSFDENGNASNRTDLTGPVCDGARFAFSSQGRREIEACLTGTGVCSDAAVTAIVALNVIAHESLHLRGETDEAGAECGSIAEGPRTAAVVGLSPVAGQMLGWTHAQGMNQFTPPEYRVTANNCEAVAALEQQPPPVEAGVRDRVTAKIGAAWALLGE